MRDIDPRLSNIIDIQFLHGYYEPTLLILYEPLKTWPGYENTGYTVVFAGIHVSLFRCLSVFLSP